MLRRAPVRLIPLFFFSAALAACGGDENGDGGIPDAAQPEGDHHAYVVDELTIPENATQGGDYGVDLNLDGDVDNKLGELMQTVLGVADFDVNQLVGEQFQEGTIIVLADLQATDLSDASAAGFWVYIGDDPSNAPCDGDDCGQHLDGQTSFSIHPDSPTEAGVVGDISGGSYEGGPGDVSLTIDFIEAIPALTVDLVGARVEIDDVSEDGLVSGRIGGGLTIDQLHNDIAPVAADALTDVIDEECEGPQGDEDNGEDDENGSPCGCPEDQEFLDTIIGLLDVGDTCEVEAVDIIENNLLETVLSADVDLLNEDGQYDPTHPDDPDHQADSISLGVGFSAVGAEFADGSPQE